MRNTTTCLLTLILCIGVAGTAYADKPVREDKPFQMLFYGEGLFSASGGGALPGVSFTYNVIKELGINVDFSTLFVINMLSAGVRYHILDGPITPFLGARLGVAQAFLFGSSGVVGLAQPNGGVEFTFGHFSMNLELGATVFFAEGAIVVGHAKLGLGARF